jgi:hypothetical protein
VTVKFCNGSRLSTPSGTPFANDCPAQVTALEFCADVSEHAVYRLHTAYFGAQAGALHALDKCARRDVPELAKVEFHGHGCGIMGIRRLVSRSEVEYCQTRNAGSMRRVPDRVHCELRVCWHVEECDARTPR